MYVVHDEGKFVSLSNTTFNIQKPTILTLKHLDTKIFFLLINQTRWVHGWVWMSNYSACGKCFLRGFWLITHTLYNHPASIHSSSFRICGSLRSDWKHRLCLLSAIDKRMAESKFLNAEISNVFLPMFFFFLLRS